MSMSEVEIRQCHAIDDLASMVARSIRTSDESLRLLELALHAQNNGSPAVTTEYLERVIDSLRTLRGGLNYQGTAGVVA